MKFKLVEVLSRALKNANTNDKKTHNIPARYGVHHVGISKDENGLKTSKRLYYPLFKDQSSLDLLHTMVNAAAKLGGYHKLILFIDNAVFYIDYGNRDSLPVSIEQAVEFAIRYKDT